MGFGVWGLGFGVCGLAHLMRLMRLARPTGPSLLPAAAIESPRRSRTTAHGRASGAMSAAHSAMTPPCGPRGPDGEKQRKLDGNPAHAKRAPAAAAIHVRSLSITRPMPGWCETSRRGRIGARAPMRRRRLQPMRTVHAYPGMRALADRRRIGHRSTPRRPRARHGNGARPTRSARASPRHRFAARRRPSPSPAARGPDHERPAAAPQAGRRPARPAGLTRRSGERLRPEQRRDREPGNVRLLVRRAGVVVDAVRLRIEHVVHDPRQRRRRRLHALGRRAEQ
ncbi:Uncharacterised protein [Burkholderia pseudomallei]|nr:Uncharacterised protein [Burkholderia pseudomallei]VCN04428.1 Uncharacterised protein [Burkholderia pseudomallei]VCN07814.1 Uncharacterised protein [Burkholderia pseudomallei]VCN11676.1 Uncharacterised protein [Burkholderia pseudomallei]VCN19484.1 Uncharacterised protein [Burkholderia pseudomallei]